MPLRPMDVLVVVPGHVGAVLRRRRRRSRGRWPPPVPQWLSASVKTGASWRGAVVGGVAATGRVDERVRLPLTRVASSETVPTNMPLPVPGLVEHRGPPASTSPLRAPTKTYLPAGEPSARRPSTLTRQASRGVVPVGQHDQSRGGHRRPVVDRRGGAARPRCGATPALATSLKRLDPGARTSSGSRRRRSGGRRSRRRRPRGRGRCGETDVAERVPVQNRVLHARVLTASQRRRAGRRWPCARDRCSARQRVRIGSAWEGQLVVTVNAAVTQAGRGHAGQKGLELQEVSPWEMRAGPRARRQPADSTPCEDLRARVCWLQLSAVQEVEGNAGRGLAVMPRHVGRVPATTRSEV